MYSIKIKLFSNTVQRQTLYICTYIFGNPLQWLTVNRYFHLTPRAKDNHFCCYTLPRIMNKMPSETLFVMRKITAQQSKCPRCSNQVRENCPFPEPQLDRLMYGCTLCEIPRIFRVAVDLNYL
jgi:hypothetical protein